MPGHGSDAEADQGSPRTPADGQRRARFQRPWKRSDDPETLNLLELAASGLADWVKFRFERPMLDSRRSARVSSTTFQVLSVLTTLAGLGATAAALLAGDAHTADTGAQAVSAAQQTDSGMSAWVWVGAGFGVLVGVLTTYNQIARPGQRSVANHQVGHRLRKEGWDYVSGRGAYRDKPAPQALDMFIDEVDRIGRVTEAIDESPGEQGPAAVR